MLQGWSRRSNSKILCIQEELNELKEEDESIEAHDVVMEKNQDNSVAFISSMELA